MIMSNFYLEGITHGQVRGPKYLYMNTECFIEHQVYLLDMQLPRI